MRQPCGKRSFADRRPLAAPVVALIAMRAVRHSRRHPKLTCAMKKRPAAHETARTILTVFWQVKKP
jgi:hypothetical protein